MQDTPTNFLEEHRRGSSIPLQPLFNVLFSAALELSLALCLSIMILETKYANFSGAAESLDALGALVWGWWTQDASEERDHFDANICLPTHHLHLRGKSCRKGYSYSRNCL